MGGGGGGQPENVTQTTKTEPWEGQKPFLTTVFQEAQKQYNQPGPSFFPGQTYAGYTPMQQQAQSQAASYAQGGAQDLANATADATKFSLGDVLRPDSNPYLAQHAEGATRPLYQALTQQILPQIGGEATQAGQFGGNRQGIAEALAITGTQQAAGDITSNIYNQAYNSGLEAMGRGIALAPQTLNLGLAPSSILETLGGQQQAEQQAAINEQIQRHNFGQALDSAKLAQFSNLVQGNYGGTMVGQLAGLPQGQSSPFASAVGGGLMGLSASSTIGSMLGIGATAAAPWTAGIGALMGLFMS